MCSTFEFSSKNHLKINNFGTRFRPKKQRKINKKHVEIHHPFWINFDLFGDHFGSLWGPFWEVLASKRGDRHWAKPLFLKCYNKNDPKMQKSRFGTAWGSILGPSWLIFGPSRTNFGSILEPLGLFFERCWRHYQQSTTSNHQPTKNSYQPTTNNQQPGGANRPHMFSTPPAAINQHPTSNHQQNITNLKHIPARRNARSD